MKKTAIAAALLLVSGAANSATLNIDSLNVSGGLFNMGAPVDAGGASTVGAFDLTMGEYAQNIVTWNFGFFGPVTNYTAASCNGECAGGGPAPSGTVDDVAGTITVDMSSWFAFWNGNDFNQGGTATGTYDANTGAFTIGWSSLIVGGSFDGNTGYWELSGVANTSTSEVPVPAAVWLFGSGLIGLAGIARRRKAA